MKTETPRQIAHRVAGIALSGYPWTANELIDAIEAALNAERERALSDAARQECVFCAGVEGYNSLPVKGQDCYVHRVDPPHGLAGIYCKAPRIRNLIAEVNSNAD